MTKKNPIPVHQWTHNGSEVLVIRFSDKNGRSKNDFQYPLTIGEVAEAPDWSPTQNCGGGLHGWAWGIGWGDGKDPDYQALWQVYGVDPKDIVGEIDGGMKVKFRKGILRCSGEWHKCLDYIIRGQMAWVFQNSEGKASASGDNGSASASGDNGSASASGYNGSASASGSKGSASASGDNGSASASGSKGSASASGSKGSASASGKALAAVVTGYDGRAKAPEFGCIALAWWNAEESRYEMRCALVGKGKGKVKPDTWYRLDADTGEFVEAT